RHHVPHPISSTPHHPLPHLTAPPKMGPSPNPRTPYTITTSTGGPRLALATVGALPSTHPHIPPWNPFARNNTPYRNIILIGQDADAEHRYQTRHPFFNPYRFATVGAVLDCQRLYDMLHPGLDTIGLRNLIPYCFPGIGDIEGLCLHNAGNDAVWELRCCLVLLKELAERLAMARGEFPKLWDAVFVAVDVEAMNGEVEHVTELGFAWLDSRDVGSIYGGEEGWGRHVRSKHVIVKGEVPRRVNGVRRWRRKRYGGNFNTDDFYGQFGTSREIWPSQIPRHVDGLFFVPGARRWIAPGGLRPEDEGECAVEYGEELVRMPR
ncbi:MAG: hypothetical protein Q9195_009076, partial [Heterodermia aff. obscurata]